MTRALLVVMFVGSAGALAQPQLPDAPRRPYPEGAIGPTCRIRTEIQASVTSESVRLRFFLVSRDAKPRVVKLTNPCPAGVVRLSGLPAGFDAMHTCQRGACVEPTTEQTFTVPARGRVEIGETVLRARGDACNPELPFGSTIVTAQVSSDDPMDVCTGGAVHFMRERSGRLRRAKPNELVVKETPVAPPAPKSAPGKMCPACAFACVRGRPSTRKDQNGCPVCACDNDTPGF